MRIADCWYKGKCTNNCTESCVRFNLVYSLFSLSKLPESQWNYKELSCLEKDLNAFQLLASKAKNILDFVESGENLYIYSKNCGNGKTSWAIRFMWNYFDQIWHKSNFDCKALFINVPNFLYNCKRSISQDVKGFEDLCNLISEVDLVVWDDIGDNTATGYEHQILLQYIDGRINSGKSNIYTSNRDFEGLQSTVGDRLASRIFNCSTCVEFKETDKRGLR